MSAFQVFNPSPAMAAAFRAIEQRCNPYVQHRKFLRRLIAAGTGHPVQRARYGERLLMLLGYSINTAILKVDCWYEDEHRAYLIALAHGTGIRLPLDVLWELRLLLRLLKRSAYRNHLSAIIRLVLAGEAMEPVPAEAAE